MIVSSLLKNRTNTMVDEKILDLQNPKYIYIKMEKKNPTKRALDNLFVCMS
jgi:hypothetical protein